MRPVVSGSQCNSPQLWMATSVGGSRWRASAAAALGEEPLKSGQGRVKVGIDSSWRRQSEKLKTA